MRSVSPGLFIIAKSYLGVWPTMLAVNSRVESTSNSSVTVLFHGLTPDPQAEVLPLP